MKTFKRHINPTDRLHLKVWHAFERIVTQKATQEDVITARTYYALQMDAEQGLKILNTL